MLLHKHTKQAFGTLRIAMTIKGACSFQEKCQIAWRKVPDFS